MRESGSQNNLALLAVVGSVMVTALYSEGFFELWDFLPGLFLLSVTLSNWNHVGVGWASDISISIILGASLLMMGGFLFEPALCSAGFSNYINGLIGDSLTKCYQENVFISRNDLLSAVWAFLSLGALLLRRFLLAKKS